VIKQIGKAWAGLSMATQFAGAGGVVIVAAALAVGMFVADRIEEIVVRNTAIATALYLESVTGPLTQSLTESETLARRTDKDLSQVLAQTGLGRRVISFKVWRQGGFILDASNRDLIGKTFAVTDNLRRAWAGTVQGDFEDNLDAEDAGEAALGVPLLEIYTPIRNPKTGEVIAVIEFYEMAETLKGDIRRARSQTWAWVIGILSVIWGAMFLIVLRGSRTIDAQLLALREMSMRNLSLRLQMQEASARAATMGERALRQIGADLHDGPAQLMAFAALRLDTLRTQTGDVAVAADLAEVAGAVGEAIDEIRNLSRGLSLPDLERREMRDVLQGLADAHAARSGTTVQISGAGEFPLLGPAQRLPVFRFVQEGLNNAWHHAGGCGQ
jgi:signal transduction histidine kinase